MILRYIFSLLILLPLSTFAQDRQADSLALINIYNDMGGDEWKNNEGWLTEAPINEWNGITMDADRVVKFKLSNNNLIGVFSMSIYNLSALESLDLLKGELTGGLSQDLYKLTKLKTLALVNLGLSGSVPDLDGFQELSNIRLSDNEFFGSLPRIPEGSSLVKFSTNKFSGSIPDSWANNQLATLDVSYNELEGSLAVFQTLKKIKNLSIEGNNWDSGSLPLWLDELPSLVRFDGSKCNFIGDIPEYDFSDSPNFAQIIINFNELSGDISNLLNGLTDDYFWLDAKNNMFEGELTLDRFQKVSRFNLSNNNYSTLTAPDAPFLDDIELRGNTFRISTLLPHFNEFPADSMHKLYFNGQASIFEVLDTTLREPQIIKLDAGDSYSGLSYQWIQGNDTIDGATERYFEVDALEMNNLIGTFDCIMTHPDLKDSQNELVEFRRGEIAIRSDFSSSLDAFENHNIVVYPNPAFDFLFIGSYESSPNSSYRVFNLQGSLVSEGKLTNINSINISQLLSASYLLQLNIGGEIKSQKFVKI